jgi:hypothetical protein
MRVLVAITLLTACSLANEPGATPSPWLVVPDAEYSVRLENGWYRAEIPWRYTNHSDRTLLITGCFPPRAPYLEWWNGEEWQPAYLMAEPQCLSDPFEVAPGAVIADTLRMNVSRDEINELGHHVNPAWEASHDDGEYRLVWSLQDVGPPHNYNEPRLGGALRPVSQRASNVFRLRMPSP